MQHASGCRRSCCAAIDRDTGRDLDGAAQLTGKRRRGTVFPDRYHAVIIRSPRQARNNLCYVLHSWRRHGEGQKRFAADWRIDPFSTAPSFDGFKDIDARAVPWPDTYRPLPDYAPRTWLLSTGWKQHGLLRSNEVPGPKSKPRDSLAVR